MLPPSTLLGILALVTVSHACAPRPDPQLHTFNGSYWHPDVLITKRWYSVPELENPLQIPYMYPWPNTCQNPSHQPIRICFKDARSAKNLKEVVDGAIAIWSPATSAAGASTMSIEYDGGCPKDADGNFKDECLCSDSNVAKDSLVISDETKDNDPEWNDGDECNTVTTTGYSYVPEGEPDRPFRHYLKFCSYDPTDNNRQLDKAKRNMAHEFGHAMGLQHEHQRPDRDRYIRFRCRNMVGYHEARDLASEDPEDLFEDVHDADTTLAEKRERMEEVCNSWVYARYYFPIMADYLRGDQWDLNVDGQLYKTIHEAYVHSTEFDFDSIMIYDSMSASRQQGDEKYWVIQKRDGGLIHMGGDKDLNNVRITEGDVARVAQLYPCQGEECEKARTGTKEWGEIGMKVRVRGNEAVRVMAPRGAKRDER